MENLLKIELSSKKQYSFGFYNSGIDLFHHLYLKNLTNENYEKTFDSYACAHYGRRCSFGTGSEGF